MTNSDAILILVELAEQLPQHFHHGAAVLDAHLRFLPQFPADELPLAGSIAEGERSILFFGHAGGWCLQRHGVPLLLSSELKQ